MKTRLQKNDLVFLCILHIIWQLADYYSQLVRIVVGNDPSKIPAAIVNQDGITHLYFSFPKVLNEEREYTVLHIRDIFNEYLRAILLPQQTILKPYRNGNGIYDVMECLYIDLIYEDEKTLYLDIIYVDNPIAYKYVQNDEKVKI